MTADWADPGILKEEGGGASGNFLQKRKKERGWGGGGGAGVQGQSYIPLASKSSVFLSHQLHDEVLGKEVHAIRVRVKFASD